MANSDNDNYFKLGLALLSTMLFASACSVKLTDIEKEGITFVREIEKMARDVYTYLYNKWGTAIMNSISQSEQVHMDIVKTLIDEYKMSDPVGNNDFGVFTNHDLQQLYYDLTKQGDASEIDALTIGAMIEEIDIIDIQKYLAQADEDDIDTAYNTLIEGSSNHLRIFVSALSDKDVDYQPKYLSQDAYDAIINR
jgi:hypothetical protein